MLRKMLRERSRSRAVARLGILARPAEPGYSRLIEQAANAFAAPIAAVTILHGDQLCVCSAKGLDVACLPRADSFCNHVLDRGGILEVCDARADLTYGHLPCVAGNPHVGYYIGAPLTLSDRMDVGVICVFDTRPRPPASADQRAYLLGLARQATRLIEHNAGVRGRMVA